MSMNIFVIFLHYVFVYIYNMLCTTGSVAQALSLKPRPTFATSLEQ